MAVIVAKHNLPEAPKERKMRKNNDKTSAIYETTDVQTKKNYKRGTALKRQ